ncbi:hypothetical protein HQQ94_03695 [Shewanella sp. VB17]|uniref:hypothetical protein n=1 Tax=Shewanella sp. VB17 TaxID=2739432 RepID=UPI0015632AF1|nr:hypothetical protein [Shewanella sp. VB17]NRD72359.1 hypothetical protein [Shewanella sp. VB17]
MKKCIAVFLYICCFLHSYAYAEEGLHKKGLSSLNTKEIGRVEIVITSPEGITDGKVPKGTFVTYTALAYDIDSDNPTDVTEDTEWLSSNEEVFEPTNYVGNVFKAVGDIDYQAGISAVYDGVPSQVDVLTITARELLSIEIKSVTPTAEISQDIPKGLSVRYVAIGHYSGEFSEDITANPDLIWSSSHSDVFKPDSLWPNIFEAIGEEGESSDITASMALDNKTDPITSNTDTPVVSAAILESITISATRPERELNQNVAKGLSVTYTAMGAFSDGEHNITDDVVWSNSNSLAFSQSGSANNIFTATGDTDDASDVGASLDQGSDNIVSDIDTLAVSDAILLNIAITASKPERDLNQRVAKGLSVTYTATGTFSDGEHDITNDVVWSNTNASAFMQSNSANNIFIATGNTNDTSNISTSLDQGSGQGEISSNIDTLTVSDAILNSIAITASAPMRALNQDVPKGLSVTYTATGNFSDGEHNVTDVVIWSNTEPTAFAQSGSANNVFTSYGNTGQASDITASLDQGNGQGVIESNLDKLTVSDAILYSISISYGGDGDVNEGASATFIATGEYSDASRNITANVSWSNTNSSAFSQSGSDNNIFKATGAINSSSDIQASLQLDGQNEVDSSIEQLTVVNPYASGSVRIWKSDNNNGSWCSINDVGQSYITVSSSGSCSGGGMSMNGAGDNTYLASADSGKHDQNINIVKGSGRVVSFHNALGDRKLVACNNTGQIVFIQANLRHEVSCN